MPGRLCIGLQHATRIRTARVNGCLEPVDDVAAIAGVFHPPDDFRRSRTRLGKLPCHAAHLDDRHFRPIGQHDRHLQHHTERVADVIRRKFRKGLCAITALQQERLALGRQRQLLFKLARLARENQRRILGQLRLNSAKGRLIRIIRHLHPWLCAPI
jgi:hypothetical protein